MNKPQEPRIVLASRSPRRRQLLANLGLFFDVLEGGVDETPLPNETAEMLVQRLSLAKARAAQHIIEANPHNAIVIAADTVVNVGGHIFGKPHDEQEAFEMLTQLSGKTHQVITGLAIIDTCSACVRQSFQVTHVTMKKLELQWITRYIATQEPLDKAGAYAIQGRGATFVHSIQGDYFNVVGLPLSHLFDELQQLGIDLF